MASARRVVRQGFEEERGEQGICAFMFEFSVLKPEGDASGPGCRGTSARPFSIYRPGPLRSTQIWRFAAGRRPAAPTADPGDHRVQGHPEQGVERPRGNGDAEHVVGKGEEEVLADVGHRGARQAYR